jgi:hypothetical protein
MRIDIVETNISHKKTNPAIRNNMEITNNIATAKDTLYSSIPPIK